MCGICGVAYRDPRRRPDEQVLRRMADTIRHRGPDDEGIYAHGSVGLSFRRLSIIDLSAAGHQPMTNEDGTIWVVFNGEIYNFADLRRRLEPRREFQSRTDTEVLLHLYEEHGDQMVHELDGMFAFAIFDVPQQRILLARDPFGIKPLYYAFNDERFVFGSEIKPLLASGEVGRTIDKAALNDFFDFFWIPAPRSIYEQVRKLPHAHLMTLDLRTWELRTDAYWGPTYDPQAGRELDDWADEVQTELNRSVRAQMVADVPIGSSEWRDRLVARLAGRRCRPATDACALSRSISAIKASRNETMPARSQKRLAQKPYFARLSPRPSIIFPNWSNTSMNRLPTARCFRHSPLAAPCASTRPSHFPATGVMNSSRAITTMGWRTK